MFIFYFIIVIIICLSQKGTTNTTENFTKTTTQQPSADSRMVPESVEVCRMKDNTSSIVTKSRPECTILSYWQERVCELRINRG